MKIFYPFIFAAFIGTSMSAQNCAPASAFDYLDINNVKARINNGGDMWWDLINTAKYIVPKSGNVSSTFAGALWIGGLDEGGNLHMAAQTYRQSGNDFFPGPLDANANVTQQACSDFDRIWKVNKSTIDSFNAGLFATPPASIKEWPGRGNPNLSFLPDQDLAPFIDVNGDYAYNPAEGDYPAIPGDQALWFVFSDNGNTHGETQGVPLGIEVQALCYAFQDSGVCTYSTTFYHYKVINKSANSYDSVYMGIWNDPDLGCYIDDFIGTDSTNNLGVVYNGQAVDANACPENYGSTPPVLALQLLKGPMDDNGIIHYLDHTIYYVNDFTVIGHPENANDYYQYLQSIWKDDTHLTAGGHGYGGPKSTNYCYFSDPPEGNGWSMCFAGQYSDPRFIVSSGPVSLNAGAIKTFDAAAVWENTSVYPCPSFDVIDSVAACVKDYFDGIVFDSGTENISSLNQTANVFPNPVAVSSDINFSGGHIDHVEIFDVVGRKLISVEGKNENLKVNGNNLGKGLFIYRITFKNHSLQSGKLVVQ